MSKVLDSVSQTVQADYREPADYTDKYNTKLSPVEEQKFQQWQKENPRLGNTYDYDARGFWKAGAGTASNGHGSDEFKKPNHPTFSTGSKYNGVDGYQGGDWSQNKDGSWNFNATLTNLQNLGASGMQEYWDKVEPDNKLVLPIQTTPTDQEWGSQVLTAISAGISK